MMARRCYSIARILFLIVFVLTLISPLLTVHAAEEEDEGVDIDTQEAAEEATPSEDDDDVDDVNGAIPEENDVLVLTESNFDSAISSNEIILVEFYAPWCGHCKQLTPHYEKAAKRLKKATPPVALAKVDCTVEVELGKRFNVGGYPTLKFFKNGIPNDYEGPREEEGIIDYMKERSDPSWKPPPDQVVVLTKDNFSEVTDNEELVIVMFYAPWCGHCKNFAPEYEKAAQELKKNGRNVVLAKVDATVETDVAKKYDITGYPTMKTFRKGRVYKYNGETKDKTGVVVYVESQVGAASTEITSLDALKSIITKSQLLVRIVGFFDSKDDATFSMYTLASDELRDDYMFSHSFDAATRQFYKVKSGSLVIFISERYQTSFEPKWHTLEITEATKISDISKFVTEHDVPLVGEYNAKTKDRVYKTRRPIVFFFYTVDWTFEHRDATQLWRTKFSSIAKQFPGLTFVIADEDSNIDLIQSFDFQDSGEEINIGVLGEKDKKYAMEPMEEFEMDEVVSFLKKYQKGGIKPKVRSAPVPKKQKGSVVVVVGSTFERVVLDEKKDVLIELYAPWCGHCKSLEPIYADLAKKLKKNKNIVIAKMDATANDAPEGYESSGFPTIYFAPAGKKQTPISYKGGRTADEMEKFINENGVTSKAKDSKEKGKDSKEKGTVTKEKEKVSKEEL